MKDHPKFDLTAQPGQGDRPLYMQLHSLLMRRLEAGEWGEGAQFPTLDTLMQEYGVSRVTVREAMARLERDGIISRSRGRGTHVLRDPSRDRWLLLPGRWNELVAHISELASTSVERDREEIELPESKFSDIVLASRYLRLQRTNFTSNGAPYSLTDVHLAMDIYELDRAGFDTQPILPRLSQTSDLKLSRANQTLTISTADLSSAQGLGLDVGTPIAQVSRRVFDGDKRLIYIADIIYPARHLRIETELF